MSFYNPFSRRDSHSAQALAAYRVSALVSWALVVIFGIYYSVENPAGGHSIWDQLNLRFTSFSATVVVVEIYWIALLVAQLFYLAQLYDKEDAVVISAAHAVPYFILENLFVFAWILLWARGYWWPAEVFLVASVINQHILFWRVPSLGPVSHFAAVAGPYAWSLLALLWNGAVTVHGAAALIAANVFIWVFFVFGAFHIYRRSDAVLGYSLSLLTFGLALAQTHAGKTGLQWIFAWVIFAVFLVDSLYLSFVKCTSGRDLFFRGAGEREPSDAERAPLLDETPVGVA